MQLTNSNYNSQLEPIQTENDTFLSEIYLIVSESFTFAGQNLTIEEELFQANVWARLLRGIIPEERLRDAFNLAIRDHKSTYVINGLNLKLAWEKIEEGERLAQQEKIENSVVFCPERANHRIPESELPQDAEQKYGALVTRFDWLPCHKCQSKAHAAKEAEIMFRRKTKDQKKIKNVVSQAETNILSMPKAK